MPFKNLTLKQTNVYTNQWQYHESRDL